MKLKYKAAILTMILGIFIISLTLLVYSYVNTMAVKKAEFINEKENVIYVSDSIEADLLDLVRLTTTLASANVISDALVASNSYFDSLTNSERITTIADLNTTWMNTDNINDPFIKSRMDNDAALYLALQQEQHPGLYGEIFLTNKYGVMISTTGKLTTLAHYNKYWWQGAFDDGKGIIYLDDRGYDDSVAGYVLGVVVPIYDNDNNIIGILKSNFNIADIFENSIAKFHSLNLKGQYLVVRTLGLIVNGENIEPLSESVADNIIPLLNQKTLISEILNINNIDKFVTIAPINITFESDSIKFGGSNKSIDHENGNLGEGWSVIYTVDKNIVLGETKNTIRYLGFFSLGLLLFLSFSSLVLGQTLSKPFIKLKKYITKVGNGNLVKQDINISVLEIKELKQSFDKMIDSLNKTLVSNKELKYEKNLIQKYFNIVEVMIMVLDINGNITSVNKKGCEILDAEKEELIGKNWFEHFIPESNKVKAVERYKNIMQKNFAMIDEYEELIISIKRESKLISWNATLLYDNENNIIGVLSSGKDITSEKFEQQILRESEERLKRSQEIAKVGSWELDIAKKIIWASPEAFAIYEINQESPYISLLDIQKMVSSNHRDMMDKALINLIQKDKKYDVTFSLNTPSGNKWIHSQATLSYDSTGKPIKVLGVLTDITELKKYQDKLINISNHDYLTGLYNRRYFVECYEKLDNPKNYPLGIMMIDMNGMKIINDAFGHKSGDIALQKVAEILKASLREQDIIARLGGDEFEVLLPNINKNIIEEIIKKIRINSDKRRINNLTISLAVGYEIKYENSKENFDELIKLAENNMYKHKLIEGISTRNNAIKAIFKTLTDKYTEERLHSLKVSQLCKQIGEQLKLSDDDIKELKLAGLFHDIGKISIPDAILKKPGRLTKEEFEIIKRHPKISYQILRTADNYSDIATHALYHHEKWDGSGYPSGKKGEDIPLFSRIIAVADAYDAMTSVRIYKEQMSEADSVKEIIRCSGTQFDPKIAKVFVEKVLKQKWIEED